MNWISVNDELPGYEIPVFLKSPSGIFVGFRDKTDKNGENYLLLKKPSFDDCKDKVTHWSKVDFPTE
ncbi:hypothetical protein M0Q50_07625 [bacterium]|jgi:hypothetical protein|nr:hypothetical protein [bacterium]